jgi:glycosyltransferase involved in cell wall biosynthesis
VTAVEDAPATGVAAASRPRVVFVHDHLMTRGGAERGLLSMLKAAPGAEVVTSFSDPDVSYAAFRDHPVRTLPIGRSRWLTRHYRAAMPLFAPSFTAAKVDADVVVCGSSGWAQGVRTTGRKVVYFYALSRWLHEQDDYLRGDGSLARAAVKALAPPLRRWDRWSVRSGDRFVTESSWMQRRLGELYGIDADVLPLPNTLDVQGPATPVEGVEPGFFLSVGRIVNYKHVDLLVDAFAGLPDERLVVAGKGPLADALQQRATPNVRFVGDADDGMLRWLYGNAAAVISAAAEPFGLTPVEGASFGTPTVAVADGGFLDTVVPGETGVHFDRRSPDAVRAAVVELRATRWDADRIRAHAEVYSEGRFVAGVRRLIDEEAARL